MLPFKLRSPTISKRVVGSVIPKPTLPLVSIDIRSCLLLLESNP